METKRYRVTFDGTIEDGLTKEEVIKNLASFYEMDERVAEHSFFTDLPTEIRKNVDYQKATELRKNFKKLGAICRVQEVRNQTAGSGPGVNNNINLHMTKVVGWSKAIGIIIVSLSVAYYFFVYLPEKKDKELKLMQEQAEITKREQETNKEKLEIERINREIERQRLKEELDTKEWLQKIDKERKEWSQKNEKERKDSEIERKKEAKENQRMKNLGNCLDRALELYRINWGKEVASARRYNPAHRGETLPARTADMVNQLHREMRDECFRIWGIK